MKIGTVLTSSNEKLNFLKDVKSGRYNERQDRPRRDNQKYNRKGNKSNYQGKVIYF